MSDSLHPHMRPAACVALLRGEGKDLQIYLALRSKKLAFLGGFYALAGGSVDPVDERIGKRLNIDPRRSAAVREIAEELGVWLVDTQGSDAQRKALLDDPDFWERDPWVDELASVKLLEFGRWITPPFIPTRFDAAYYAAWVPSEQEPQIWPGELECGEWLRPADALAKHERGEKHITYPVLETLRALVRHNNDVTAAAAQLNARGPDAYPVAGGEMIAGVHLCPVRTHTLPPATHTNCYILGGQEFVVLDPASDDPQEQERLARYVQWMKDQGGTFKEIWLSHHHGDHVGGVADLAKRFGVPIAAHARTAELLAGTLRIDRHIADGEETVLPIPPAQPQRWVAIYTPGHASGHLCFFEKQLRSLISADNVLGIGSVLIARPDGDMAFYLDSLARMRDLEPGMMFPSHGPPIAASREKIQSYIDHRLEREHAILESLSEPKRLEQIVAAVYTDVPAALHPLAQKSVEAHLHKLDAEGRVRALDDAYIAVTS